MAVRHMKKKATLKKQWDQGNTKTPAIAIYRYT